MSEEEAAVKALGERIGYGRVIQLCERLWPPPSKPWTVLEREGLNAEVERLRKELLEVTHEVDSGILGGVLVYRIAGSELRREPVAELLREFNRLREENATQRLALDVALKPLKQGRKLIPVCPDCNNDTADHDVVEGSAHCRYCGYPVDAPQE